MPRKSTKNEPENEKLNAQVEPKKLTIEQASEFSQQTPPKKYSLFKIILGIVILMGLIVLGIWRIISISHQVIQNNFIKALVDYYQALAKNDTNKLTELTSQELVRGPETSGLTMDKFEIYVYEMTDVQLTNIEANKRLLYSIIVTRGTQNFAYLNEAYLSLQNNQPKIVMIETLKSAKGLLK